mgnify:CR=1 FL=1
MKELSEMISIMQAAKEGKEIQWRFVIRTEDGWDACTPTTRMWDWFGCDYRVKPVEPRRVWINFYPEYPHPHKIGCGHESLELAQSYLEKTPGSETVEFVEVTPEVRAKLNL